MGRQFTCLFAYSRTLIACCSVGHAGLSTEDLERARETPCARSSDWRGKARLFPPMTHFPQVINIDLSHHFRLHLFPQTDLVLCVQKKPKTFTSFNIW